MGLDSNSWQYQAKPLSRSNTVDGKVQSLDLDGSIANLTADRGGNDQSRPAAAMQVLPSQAVGATKVRPVRASLFVGPLSPINQANAKPTVYANGDKKASTGNIDSRAAANNAGAPASTS